MALVSLWLLAALETLSSSLDVLFVKVGFC